jgi:hypothetical protein
MKMSSIQVTKKDAKKFSDLGTGAAFVYSSSVNPTSGRIFIKVSGGNAFCIEEADYWYFRGDETVYSCALPTTAELTD